MNSSIAHLGQKELIFSTQIVVDGNLRTQCIANAVNLVRPGGILYLNNSDKDSEPNGGDMRQAEITLREFARTSGADLKEVTDFASKQLFVQQRMYAITPR